MNKKGWIKVVEVSFSLLLITVILLIVLEEGSIGILDLSEESYKMEASILREIELNQTLRNSVIGLNSIPVAWEDFESNGLGGMKEKITRDSAGKFNCEAKICELDDGCTLEKNIKKDVYSQSVIITSNLTKYNPRQIKIFCWRKN